MNSWVFEAFWLCDQHRQGLKTESASADFHVLRSGFIRDGMMTTDSARG